MCPPQSALPKALMASILPRNTSQGIVYHARVRIKGAPAQSSVHKRRTDAVKWAQSVEVAMREHRFFPSSTVLRHTVAEAIDRYVEELPLRGMRDERNRRRHLTWWRDELGCTLLADLSPDSIGLARDKLARSAAVNKKAAAKSKPRPRAPATVNRYLAALSHVLTVARKEWRWITRSPMADVTKAREPSGRVRYLSRAELVRLREACTASRSVVLELVVQLALTTGMRKGEILNLRWHDVDLERAQLTLQHTKNGERRTVPLIAQTCEMLRLRKPEHVEAARLLFPARQGTRPAEITHAWKKALQRAQIDDFRFHDLRHTAASYLAMAGCTSLEIADVLGHKTLQMVKRYSHLSTEHTRQSLERLGAVVLSRPAVDIAAS